MSELILVSEIITGAKSRSDMENTNFVSPSEWLDFVNAGYKELYDEIVQKYNNYFVADPYVFTTTKDVKDYALPGDFYKLLGVDVIGGSSRPLTLLPWSFNERNRITTGWINRPFRYMMIGNNIRMIPTPSTNETITVWYVPKATKVTSTSQTLECINGFEEMVKLYAAIRAKMKEEKNFQDIKAEYDDKLQKMHDALAGRDAAFPERVTDTQRLNDSAWFLYGSV